VSKPTGFMDYRRETPQKRPVADRVQDYREIEGMFPVARLEEQAARCMDCGIPSCHAFGCPLKNRIPDWNDMVYRKQWRRALELLHSTNPLPEITGRICPAPCEASCTLSINQQPVTIRQIELQIVERGWQEGWIQPELCTQKTGKRVAVIGSGPAGLAAAQILARQGHEVVVFEKSDQVGGILRFGIPDFKLEKWVLDRRLEQFRAEGVVFETGVNAGIDISAKYLRRMFQAIVITTGAGVPRNLDIQGRNLNGVHFAMDFLTQQNRRNAGLSVAEDQEILAQGKRVVVIGGGDTGSDCVGTSRRQGAIEIRQHELLPKPSETRPDNNPWPFWPQTLRSSSSHEEGCERDWSVETKEFVGENGVLKALKCVRLDWSGRDTLGRPMPKAIPGSEFEVKADLALLAMGFLHVEHGALVQELGLKRDPRGNLTVDGNLMTSVSGVFAGGDSERGASLVVRAIDRGCQAAFAVGRYLEAK